MTKKNEGGEGQGERGREEGEGEGEKRVKEEKGISKDETAGVEGQRYRNGVFAAKLQGKTHSSSPGSDDLLLVLKEETVLVPREETVPIVVAVVVVVDGGMRLRPLVLSPEKLVFFLVFLRASTRGPGCSRVRAMSGVPEKNTQQ